MKYEKWFGKWFCYYENIWGYELLMRKMPGNSANQSLAARCFPSLCGWVSHGDETYFWHLHVIGGGKNPIFYNAWENDRTRKNASRIDERNCILSYYRARKSLRALTCHPPFRILSTIPSFRIVLYCTALYCTRRSEVVYGWIPKVANFPLLVQIVRPILGRASCCLIINII